MGQLDVGCSLGESIAVPVGRVVTRVLEHRGGWCGQQSVVSLGNAPPDHIWKSGAVAQGVEPRTSELMGIKEMIRRERWLIDQVTENVTGHYRVFHWIGEIGRMAIVCVIGSWV